jgi:hypothetical protein
MSVQIAISFDATASMYPCIAKVKSNVKKLASDLFTNIPGVEIGILVHLDYPYTPGGDDVPYITQNLDFTQNLSRIDEFVNQIESSSNSDTPECYELALFELRTKYSWKHDSKKAIVMIGDSVPHGPADANRNPPLIDWKAQARAIQEERISFYSVQCLYSKYDCDKFWKPLAELTDGLYIRLDQFSDVIEYLQAITQHANGDDGHIRSMVEDARTNNRLTVSRAQLYSSLLREEIVPSGGSTSTTAAASGLVPVEPSRFQVFNVGPSKVTIKQFAEENGLVFRAGRGFYEMQKPEIISSKKEIVLQDTASGNMYTGQEAISYLGGGVGSGSKVKVPSTGSWRVFIQSTSYSRNLDANSCFLYDTQ